MLTPHSKPMHEILSLVEKISPSEFNVLLMGESGVGRQTLARYIHEKSPRSAGPFVPVNLVATIDVHDTLFGRAATTSSKTAPPRSRTGLVRSVHGGTLLLQNAEDMSLSQFSLPY
jgi:DNA-binding NtrC family response regulator